MGLLAKISRIYRSAKQMYQRSMKSSPKELYLRAEIKSHGLLSESPSDNLIIQGDNRAIIRSLIADDRFNKKINLIYVDPPFFSMADYDAVLQALSIKHIRTVGHMVCLSISKCSHQDFF